MECLFSLNDSEQTKLTNLLIKKINVANILEKLSPKLKKSFLEKFKDGKVKEDRSYYLHEKCNLIY